MIALNDRHLFENLINNIQKIKPLNFKGFIFYRMNKPGN